MDEIFFIRKTLTDVCSPNGYANINSEYTRTYLDWRIPELAHIRIQTMGWALNWGFNWCNVRFSIFLTLPEQRFLRCLKITAKHHFSWQQKIFCRHEPIQIYLAFTPLPIFRYISIRFSCFARRRCRFLPKFPPFFFGFYFFFKLCCLLPFLVLPRFLTFPYSSFIVKMIFYSGLRTKDQGHTDVFHSYATQCHGMPLLFILTMWTFPVANIQTDHKTQFININKIIHPEQDLIYYYNNMYYVTMCFCRRIKWR